MDIISVYITAKMCDINSAKAFLSPDTSSIGNILQVYERVAEIGISTGWRVGMRVAIVMLFLFDVPRGEKFADKVETPEKQPAAERK